MKKKVISIVFNNFINDTRVLKECTSLANSKLYDVEVVALNDNNQLDKETLNNFTIRRIKLKSRKLPKKFFFQLIKYLELSSIIIKDYREVDIIHCNDLAPLPIASFLKFISNRKINIVYDAHEYETETNGSRGVRKLIAKTMEKIFINSVDVTLTVSNTIAEEYTRLYGIEKPKLILNCPPYLEVKNTNKFREKFNIPKTDKIFLYQGGLMKGRGLELVLESFSLIEQRGLSASLVIMGYGPLETLVKEYVEKKHNIYFQEAVLPKELMSYTSSADVGICLIEETCLSYKYSLPNKFFEYSMAGIPTITNNLIEVSSIVKEYNCGWILANETPLAFLELVECILEEDLSTKNKGLNKIALQYNWENEEIKLLDVYKNIK